MSIDTMLMKMMSVEVLSLEGEIVGIVSCGTDVVFGVGDLM